MAANAFLGEVLNLVKRQATNQNNDQNIGSATENEKNNSSASQLLATLIPVGLVALVWIGVFTIIRPKAAWKYSPRSQSKILNKNAYTPALGNSRFGWVSEMWKIPDTYVLTHQSLDSYLFLRFLKLAIVACLVGCIITWPVLFPINATGGAGQKELDILSMSNVLSPWRFWGHAICAWVYFGFILFLITRESIFYINLRQAYLMNPAYTRKLSSRTVLYTGVPDDLLHEEALREVLGNGVTRVWFPTNTKELDDLVDERDKNVARLEAAESKLIKQATLNHLKKTKKNKGEASEINNSTGLESGEGASGSIAAKYISHKDRPTHKLKFLIGKKVDTIDWCRQELQTTIPKVAAEQAKHASGDAPRINAVFVEFNSLREAQAAYQTLTHHSVFKMSDRLTGMHPSDVIWSNLRIKGWERFIRNSLATAFVVALIIFWSIPVAVVGAISNISYLTDKLPWLSFILSIPKPILGVVTGLLPAVMLALLMALLPPLLRFVAILGGRPTYSAAEYTLQNYYFGFQVVQVFLVTTLASAASSAVTDIINNPASVTSLLSTNLPKASNFFLSYIILQGLGVFSSVLVGLVGYILTPLLVKFLGNTPRKVFQKWNKLATVSWGVVYPVFTNLWVIAICYACIAPLVLVFAAIGLFFFYFAYRYNFLFVFDTHIDEKGAGYPRALQHIFVGLYIAEICLLGLFATRLDNVGAIGPFILMILLLIFTAMFQIGLQTALGPLLKYLPKTLEAEEHKALLQSRQNGTSNGLNGTNGTHHHGTNGVHDPSKTELYPADGGEDGLGNDTMPKNSNTILDAAPHKKPNMLQKFLKPNVYADYATMRRLVPSLLADEGSDAIDDGLVRHAYLPPSVWREVQPILLPRDTLGVSAQEVRDTRKAGLECSDDAAHLDDKGKIVVDDERMAEYFFQTREQRLKNDPAFSASLLAGERVKGPVK